MPKKLTTDDVNSSQMDAPGAGPELVKVAPRICEWLCDVRYDDGSPKGKTRLQIERKGPRVVVLLKDSDSGLMVETSHEMLQDALLTLELLLGSEDCPWTLDPFPLHKPAKRGKK